MGKHIYISYAEPQMDLMEDIKFALEDEGVQVFEQPPGVNPVQARRVGISGAVAFVAILSTAFENVRLCQKELQEACDAQLPVIVIRAGPATAAMLEKLQQAEVTVTELPAENAAEDIFDIDVIAEQLTSRTPPSATPTPDSNPAAPIAEFAAPKAPEIKHDVFISYTSADVEDARALCSILDIAGLTYWDFKQSERTYEEALYEEIERAILGCRVFVALESDDYDESSYSMDEHAFAGQIGRDRLHVRFKKKRPKLRAASRTYVDCVDENRMQGMKDLVDNIRRLCADFEPVLATG